MLNSIFQRAEDAFRSGQLAQAQQLLSQLERMSAPNADIFHLRALCERRLGASGTARSYFERALSLAPDNAQILNNFGNLLNDLGDDEAALLFYQQAVARAPTLHVAVLNIAILQTKLKQVVEARQSFRRAEAAHRASAKFWSAWAALERDCGDLDAAAQYYRTALQCDPTYRLAILGVARVALERGEEEAPSIIASARTLLPDEPLLPLNEAQALASEGDPRGPDMLDALLREQPLWLEARLIRANLHWESGNKEAFHDCLARGLAMDADNPDVHAQIASTLIAAEQFEEADNIVQSAKGRFRDHAVFHVLDATIAVGLDDTARAAASFGLARAAEAPATVPEARLMLRLGEVDHAQHLLEAETDRDIGNISAWAYLDICWRLTGNAKQEWLHGQSNLWKLRPLDTTARDIEAICAYLRNLHQTKFQPIGQSVRLGTQTRGSLLSRPEPEARFLRETIYRALQTHWAELPDFDPKHPLLRHKARQPRFSGSWSVRLTDGGFHVAHIHPNGVLSSASYWAVPDDPGLAPQSGHLEIGRPPPELGLDLPPLAIFQPKPGHLALFPSTLMHGTRPFAEGERMTVAFDVIAS